MPVQTIHPDKTNPTNPLLDEFLNYVLTIKKVIPKNRLRPTAMIWLYLFPLYLNVILRWFPKPFDFGEIPIADVSDDVLKSVNLGILYAFLSYSSKERHNADAARSRKVSSLRSF